MLSVTVYVCAVWLCVESRHACFHWKLQNRYLSVFYIWCGSSKASEWQHAALGFLLRWAWQEIILSSGAIKSICWHELKSPTLQLHSHLMLLHVNRKHRMLGQRAQMSLQHLINQVWPWIKTKIFSVVETMAETTMFILQKSLSLLFIAQIRKPFSSPAVKLY